MYYADNEDAAHSENVTDGEGHVSSLMTLYRGKEEGNGRRKTGRGFVGNLSSISWGKMISRLGIGTHFISAIKPSTASSMG